MFAVRNSVRQAVRVPTRRLAGVPGALRVGALNHVAIAVPDLPRSVGLYRDVLGARVSEPQDLPGELQAYSLRFVD